MDSGSLGELGLLSVLETAVDGRTARRAAEGWGADRYVAWRWRGRTCVGWNIAMDTNTDTAEVVAALRRWAADHTGASVIANETVVVSNCA